MTTLLMIARRLAKPKLAHVDLGICLPFRQSGSIIIGGRAVQRIFITLEYICYGIGGEVSAKCPESGPAQKTYYTT